MGRSQYVELHYSKKLLALTEEPTSQKAIQTIQNLVPNSLRLGTTLATKSMMVLLLCLRKSTSST